MSNRYIINLDDGTVCGAGASVIVDIDGLDDDGKALWQDWLDTTSDHVAFELGEQYGAPIRGYFGNTDDDKQCIIKWSAKDVQQLKPTWSLEKCQSWLDGNSRHLADRLIETGWEVLESFILSEE